MVFSHKEFSNKFITTNTITVLIIDFIVKYFFALFGVSYKNNPNIKPDNASLIVKPGKYAPNGHRMAPIKSP